MLNGQLYSSFVKCSCVLFIEYQNELIFKRKYTGSSPVGWGLASVSSWLHCCYHHHRNCRDCQAFLPLVTRCSFLQFTELLSSLPRGPLTLPWDTAVLTSVHHPAIVVALVQRVGLLLGYHLAGPALAGPALPHLLASPAWVPGIWKCLLQKDWGSMVLIPHPLGAAAKRQGDRVVWLWGSFFPWVKYFVGTFFPNGKKKKKTICHYS